MQSENISLYANEGVGPLPHTSPLSSSKEQEWNDQMQSENISLYANEGVGPLPHTSPLSSSKEQEWNDQMWSDNSHKCEDALSHWAPIQPTDELQMDTEPEPRPKAMVRMIFCLKINLLY